MRSSRQSIRLRRPGAPVQRQSHLYIPGVFILMLLLALYYHISFTNQVLHPTGRFTNIHIPGHDKVKPTNMADSPENHMDLTHGLELQKKIRPTVMAQKKEIKHDTTDHDELHKESPEHQDAHVEKEDAEEAHNEEIRQPQDGMLPQQQLPPRQVQVDTSAQNKFQPSESDLNHTIAYAISLVKCGDHQTHAAGLMDAALVLRHSIHQISSRNGKSKYDYHMWAIVHRQAVECSHLLEQVGFQIMVVDAPIQPDEIQGEFLKKKIHKEWCCGHDEFIKWFPYKMTQYPAVVHLDIDYAFLQPLDELFDAIKYDKDSKEGKTARSLIIPERMNDTLPDKIDAFFTRDWPQVVPGRTPGYQAGFIVVRPDPTVFDELVAIVRKGHYVEGFSRTNGWGGLGYGGFVGAMAMQGLMAYFYDHIKPNTSVELNQCRYNWMGMDIRYRAAPNFRKGHPKTGMCRNDLQDCEDCMVTDVSKIKTVHYTQCRKPWNCVGVGVPGGAKGSAIDTNAGNYEKCMEIVTKWHELRADLESKLYALTKDPRVLEAASSNYKVDIFKGHCRGEGGKNYTQIDASEETFSRLSELYKVR